MKIFRHFFTTRTTFTYLAHPPCSCPNRRDYHQHQNGAANKKTTKDSASARQRQQLPRQWKTPRIDETWQGLRVPVSCTQRI